MTGGLEEDALADAYEAQHDDYNKIMVKAIADRGGSLCRISA